MKRHFSFGFKALAACAMSAMLAVSCYDDSKLWEEIEGLEERVAALEEKLNTEVATLNSKIGTLETAYKAADADLVKAVAALTEELDALDGTVDGYITSNDEALKAAIDELKKADAALAAVDTETLAALAKLGVVSVETNANGNVVLTFTDKTTLEVPANPESGLVTIVDGHWAVVVDGKTTVLDALVLPDTTLDFRVGDDNTLYVSYDAGKTWESTGVVVDGQTLANVVTGVKYNKGDEFVTLVVGKTEYQFPVYEADNSSLVLGRTDAFFMYGASKNINLKAEGITEYYVMSKPDGWKASVEGTTLTITSPSKELIEFGAGELKGQVLIHATTENGTCKVAKIEVSTGAAVKLSYNDGEISLFTAYATEQTNFFGETYYDFVGLQFGINTMEDYLSCSSYDEFINICADNYLGFGDIISHAYNNNIIEQNWYEDGVCENITITMTLKDIVDKFTYGELMYDEDETYVFWVMPKGEEGLLADEALSVFTGDYVNFEVSESLYNNVEFDASFVGSDSYIIGAISKSTFDEYVNQANDPDYTHEVAFKEYMTRDMGMAWYNGPFVNFVGGDENALGNHYPAGSCTLELSELVESVDFNSEYFVWVLPYNESKPLSEYKFDDLRIYTCKTAAMTEDPSIAVTTQIGAVTYNSYEYTLTPSAGTKFYYEVMPAKEFEEKYMEEGVVNADAFYEEAKWGYPYDESISETSSYGLKLGITDYVLVTYSFANGYYAIEVTEFEITSLNDHITSLSAGSTFEFDYYAEVSLTEPIVVTKDLTINLNRATISSENSDIFEVRSGTLTIDGKGNVTAGSNGGYVAVWANGGNVVINDGTYNVGADANGKTNDCIYAKGGTITINGGTFSNEGTYDPSAGGVVINANNTVANSKVIINGGTFTPAEGCVAYEQADRNAGRVVYYTPDKQQWVTENPAIGYSIGAATDGLFDLGVATPVLTQGQAYWSLGVDYGKAMGSEAGVQWVIGSYYGSCQVTPTDATSGIVTLAMLGSDNSIEVPYSNYTGTTCTFDFSKLNMGEIEFKLAQNVISY